MLNMLNRSDHISTIATTRSHQPDRISTIATKPSISLTHQPGATE
jgi:hypothetical protein